MDDQQFKEFQSIFNCIGLESRGRARKVAAAIADGDLAELEALVPSLPDSQQNALKAMIDELKSCQLVQ